MLPIKIRRPIYRRALDEGVIERPKTCPHCEDGLPVWPLFRTESTKDTLIAQMGWACPACHDDLSASGEYCPIGGDSKRKRMTRGELKRGLKDGTIRRSSCCDECEDTRPPQVFRPRDGGVRFLCATCRAKAKRREANGV